MALGEGRLRRAAFLLVLGLFVGCGEARVDEVPQSALGKWTTSHPRYADRSFEIQTTTVRFEVEGGAMDSYPIKKIVEAGASGSGAYSIVYESSVGLEYRFSFQTDGGGELRLLNQPEITWRREAVG